jgi:hypothetical protein
MSNSNKDILITPNTGTANKPGIRFNSINNNPVNLFVEDTGALSVEGSAGQLFSITDSLTGTIFAVNDAFGIPVVDVTDAGIVRLSPFAGRVGIGKTPSYTLDVAGYANASGYYMNGQSVGGGYLLASGNLPTNASSLVISSIPQTFKNLRLVIRNMFSTTNGAQFFVRFNNDANGSRHYNNNYSNGNNNNFSYNDTAFYVSGSTWSSSNFGYTVIDFPEYFNTSTYKMANVISNHTSTNGEAWGITWNSVGWYRSQAALTSIGLYSSSGNWSGGSYQLYGVR